MNEKSFTIEASDESMDEVTEFIHAELEKTECSDRTRMELEIAIEEIFVNISHYAYAPKQGNVEIRCSISSDSEAVVITFLDNGLHFDPLSYKEADTSRESLEKQEGGLGIYMVKKYVDDISYSYENGQNILTIKKLLS